MMGVWTKGRLRASVALSFMLASAQADMLVKYTFEGQLTNPAAHHASCNFTT